MIKQEIFHPKKSYLSIVSGLSSYKDLFSVNNIDLNSFALLTEDLIKELIGRIGDRARFPKKLKDWNAQMTNPFEELDGSTHTCVTEQCAGGVGRNMAEALWRLTGGRAKLLTAVADDAEGSYVKERAPGLVLDGCTITGGRTSSYATLLDAQGDCRLGLGDMALHEQISVQMVNQHLDVLENSPIVVLDGNIPQTTMTHILDICHSLQKPVFFEPTDRRKAIKAISEGRRLAYASPNINELRAIATHIKPGVNEPCNEIETVLEMCNIASKAINVIIVTLGAKGVLIFRTNESSATKAKLYPAEVVSVIENVSGAGDCFASGFLYGVLTGLDESLCVSLGFKAAKCALKSKSPVPTSFSLQNISRAKSCKLTL